MRSFRQETSFIERLRVILLVIAGFFVLGIMGLYLSSRGFLSGLKEINTANHLLNMTGTTLQALQATREHLIESKSKLSSTQLVSIREATRLADHHVKESLSIHHIDIKVKAKLEESLNSLHQYESSIEKLASSTDGHFAEETLIAREYLTDTEDDLREAQILIRKNSDKRFSDVYENRFDPLIVAGLLSSAFFGFVVIVGLSNARRLQDALRNLNLATDAVAKGDLQYEATILENDEFGKLTWEFNKMVMFLREKQQKLTDAIGKVTRLQSITNSFSSTLLPEEVYDVIVRDVHRALRADAGAICLLSDDGKVLENRLIGYKSPYTRIGMDFHSPMTLCVRTGEALFFESIETLRMEFPAVYDVMNKSGVVSVAYIPLTLGGQIYGAINFGFRLPRYFNEEEKEFMTAITRQCAQAIHRARLYKEATDAIHVRDEFLSIASHELRTPLTPLKLQLQNMSRQVRKGKIDLPNKENVLKMVDNSDRQVDRLITLIDDLLDVSRISAGRLTLNFEEFNFGEMVLEIVSHYSSHTKEADSLISCNIEDNVFCYADRVRMEQVLINLLTNALKYAPRKPIHVSSRKKDNLVHLEVRDEGEGISPENQQRIFDRFERVRDKNNIGGLGLGLYICRQIVEAHQGHISVVSEPHKGATFIVEIPALS